MAVAAVWAPAAAAAPKPTPKPLPAPEPPNTFLLTPTDQLGFPGFQAGASVTPEGSLFTGWGELTFNISGSEEFAPRSHTLLDGRLPVVHLFNALRGVLYELDAFEANVSGHPVVFARVRAKNLLPRRNRARIAAGVRKDGGDFVIRHNSCCRSTTFRFPVVRPPSRDGQYYQPGDAFNAAAVYSLAGIAQTGSLLLRDGQVVALIGGGAPGVTVSQSLHPSAGAVTKKTQFGRTVYDMSLGPRQSREVVFRMPVGPVAPTDPVLAKIAAARFGEYRAIVTRYWRSLLGGVMRLSVPERKVVDTFYASIMQDALARYQTGSGQWVQAVNKLRYNAFYLRDGAIITGMYDRVGLHRQAAENLDYFLTWQRDDGLFISQDQEYDGFGQALWAMGEHYRRTGDTAFAQRVLPAVSRAMAWFEAQRGSDPLTLMPPVQGRPPDNELVLGHIAGDNFWAAAGLAGAVDLARAAGDGAAAARWQSDYNAFVVRLRGEVAKAAAANGGAIPPALDVRGGQDWGNLYGAYPWPVLSPTSKLVQTTIARFRRKFREGIATYAGTQLLHHWLGFRVFETELLAGQQQNVVEGLYDELAHTTGTGAGFETGLEPFGDRVVDDATTPHGAFAAEYATLLRNMLVREQGDRDLYLMSAVSPAWLRPGKRIVVGGAPTTRGPVSFTLTGTKGGATLTWRADVKPGTRLIWPVPYAARQVSARGLNRRLGAIVLPGRSGRLSVTWTLAGTDPTYDRTWAHLMQLYFNSSDGAVAARHRRAAGALPEVSPLRLQR